MIPSFLPFLPLWVSVLSLCHDSIQFSSVQFNPIFNPISLCPGMCQARAKEGKGDAMAGPQ